MNKEAGVKGWDVMTEDENISDDDSYTARFIGEQSQNSTENMPESSSKQSK